MRPASQNTVPVRNEGIMIVTEKIQENDALSNMSLINIYLVELDF